MMAGKTAVIFYSSTGNTEAMAEAVAVGARSCGADVLLASVSDVDAETIGKEYDCILLGCSAWGVEVIEEAQMKPFSKKLEPFLKGKYMGVFGSCGWSRGAWLNSWESELHFAGGIFPAAPVRAYGYPDEESLKACEELGKTVVKEAENASV
jgi:flavodoxin